MKNLKPTPRVVLRLEGYRHDSANIASFSKFKNPGSPDLGGYRHIGESLKMSDNFRFTKCRAVRKVRLKIRLKGNLFLAKF